MSTLNLKDSVLKEKQNREAATCGFSLVSLTKPVKHFLSLMLLVAAFCYLTLIMSIWNDTELKIASIIEGYGDMGNIELVEHTLKYMYWFFGIFFMTVGLFLYSSAREKTKSLFAIGVPLLIMTDIGSAWMIRYQSFFAYTLFLSGVFLALSFFLMFICIQKDLWLGSHKETNDHA